jgi:hypothetical protein
MIAATTASERITNGTDRKAYPYVKHGVNHSRRSLLTWVKNQLPGIQLTGSTPTAITVQKTAVGQHLNNRQTIEESDGSYAKIHRKRPLRVSVWDWLFRRSSGAEFYRVHPVSSTVPSRTSEQQMKYTAEELLNSALSEAGPPPAPVCFFVNNQWVPVGEGHPPFVQDGTNWDAHNAAVKEIHRIKNQPENQSEIKPKKKEKKKTKGNQGLKLFDDY